MITSSGACKKNRFIQYKSEIQIRQYIICAYTGIDGNATLINCVSYSFAQYIEIYIFSKGQHSEHIM